MDLCDESPVDVVFCCRAGVCGMCRVTVLQGAEHFEKAGPPEEELLQSLGSAPNVRLACQARLRAGPGQVVIEPLGSSPAVCYGATDPSVTG